MHTSTTWCALLVSRFREEYFRLRDDGTLSVVFKNQRLRKKLRASPQGLEFNLADKAQTNRNMVGFLLSFLAADESEESKSFFCLQESIGDRLSKLAHGAGPSRRKRHLKEKSEQKPAVSHAVGKGHECDARVVPSAVLF